MNRCVVLGIMGLTILPLLHASNASEQQAAVKKLEDALSKTNIFELPSFQMKAMVEIDNQGNPLDGSYRLLWNDPEHWREEISFAGYNEIQVGDKEKVWIQRSTNFIPLRIYQLHAALGFGSSLGVDVGQRSGSFAHLDLGPKDKIKKLRSRERHGEKFTCMQAEDEHKHTLEICVNESTGTFLRGASYEDGEYQSVGEKLFPRSLSFVEKGQPVVKIRISELNTSGQFSADAFAPPPGISPEAGCMNPIPYRRISSVAPQYPQDARQNHIEGTVAVDVLIGTDGLPRVRKVVASPLASLANSTSNAVSGWRYQPAACNGKPVAVETVLRINYQLSP